MPERGFKREGPGAASAPMHHAQGHHVMTYATREEYLEAFIANARPHFEAANAPLPSNVRVAVGFTSRGSKGTRIGEVWSSEASEDGMFEIFVSPKLADAAAVCAVLTHELVHCAVGLDRGHGPHLKRVATSLGLGGKMTATQATQVWYSWALPIISRLGDMPYGALATDGISSASPKQATALLKVECPVCGWLARVTRKHIAPHGFLTCPVPSCDGELICEELEQVEEAA